MSEPAPDTRRVSSPYENRRKPVGRDGTYPWAVTLRSGHLAETHTYYTRAEADALVAKAERAGYRRTR